MCLAVPTRVLTVEGHYADVEMAGVSRRISIALTPDVKPGDYVLVHTGYAISIVDEEEAEETLKLFRELSPGEEGL
ncbi:MAG TPA: HypC/HybG/HupF family hydrogenase formation chaperone [Thermodesulfobacteriota bacterium]|nr:HypC/HybG/HupF family hydrogenase formation chaperone [Deltaproteobacteria bacterium]HNR14642.1 HypC/HybG/HupF family hydrogenase formation chaperone [Thermodesulfobacteriota bacterium]HNU70164.1 HypC/HybG/HupF family hydrogenase formation chaperone [Thermodesulfobacteriota bacterium]HQO79395.1 HypC/HybG/HupF family hydrogenase formation chaperone [Thermodesulfobacteriota bacterium]